MKSVQRMQFLNKGCGKETGPLVISNKSVKPIKQSGHYVTLIEQSDIAVSKIKCNGFYKYNCENNTEHTAT